MTQFTRKVDGYDGDWVRADDINDLQEAIEQQSFNVKRYGAVGDGVTDDTAAIQAAIDAADTVSVSSAGGLWLGPTVILSPGIYSVDDTISAKRPVLMGVGRGAASAEIRWNGAAGGTVMEYSDASGVTQSFGGVYGIRFSAGDNSPATYLDLTNHGIDVFFQLEHCHFGAASNPVIVGTWWNCHWSHLRFDSWTEYAITLNAASSQSYSNFHLDKFTADNGNATPISKAFMKVVHPASGAVNIGGIHLSNARVEINQLQRSPNCLVHFVDPASEALNSSLTMTNVNVSCASSCDLDSVVYREAPLAVWGTPTILNGCTVWPANTPVNAASNGFSEGYATVNASVYNSMVLDAITQVGFE